MWPNIVDDERRGMRPEPPGALRVAAASGRLLRWRSSTMCSDIAVVASPRIRPDGARNARHPGFRSGSRGASAGRAPQPAEAEPGGAG